MPISRAGRVRAPAQAALVAGLVAASAAPAAAQHHHHGGGGESESAVAGAAGVSVETGRVEAFSETREYQGLALMGAARWRSFELSAHLPLFRIELGPESHSGLGDVHIAVGWIALEHPVEAGFDVALMPPLGSDEYGLAMGHWMAMGGGFARASRSGLSGSAAVSYGTTLGGEGHVEHGVSVWPPVSPMNASEIRGSLAGRLALWRPLAATASLVAAAPIGDGEFLALVGGGLAVELGRVDVAVEASHGLAGHTAGLVVGSHLMFSF